MEATISDYIDYVGHKLEKEAKGELVECYSDYLDRARGREDFAPLPCGRSTVCTKLALKAPKLAM
jgi:hypothetical protein